MNVVGKVGGLISQGVYSVATPFHPFGGAVDVIVVQQQDGTFRSTPWYVRFGKFQGVLKGAEKVVHIAVNGVKANFHMYLDNSGEAYFIRELDSGKGSEPNGSMEVVPDDNSFVDSSDNRSTVEVCRLEHSVSDSGVTRMLVECDSLNADRIQRAESEGDRRFYEFQDEQSSLEGSVEMSDYGSNQFEGLDGENYRESQGQDSEVILVSVDGHILTAPVSASEQNTENLRLITPQFHLGPGEGAEFCAGNGEFGSNDNGWADDYISKLKSSTDVTSDNNSNVNDNDTSGHQLEVCEGDGECICQADETKDIAIEERGPQMGMDSANVKREDVFKSCLELTALAKQGRNADFDETGSSLDVPELREKSLESRIVVSKTKGDVKTEIINNTEDNSKTEDISNREDDNKTKDINNNEDGKKTEDVNSTVDDNKTEDLCKIVDYNRSEDGEAYRNDDGLNRFEDEVYRNDDGLSPSCILDSLCNNSCADPRVEQEVDEKSGLDTEKVVSDGESVDSVSNNTEWKNEQCDTSATVEGVDDALCGSMHKGNCSQIKSIEPPRTSIIEGMTLSGTNAGFEISLCGNELRAGMGLDAAAEAFNAHRISENEFRRNATSIIKNENLVIRYRERYLLWEKAAPFVLGVAAFGLELSVEQKDAIPVEAEEIQKCKENDSGVTSTSSGRKWRLWPILLGRVKTHEHTSSNSSSEDVFVDSECGLQNSQESPESTAYSESPHKQFIRTNVPTIEQVASLNLKDGQNMITFSFSTRVLGTQQVDAHIYLWKWNARIVISDVDGTITKSDVLGQFMPLVGKDWTQSGVAKLFSAIKENGYQLLFLSARAIVQAYLTRSFLLNLKQDGKALPNGPVVISPDGLFPSLYREVIRRAPHEFKIACLEDIKKLFPSDYNPFYAGFGNRDTDELSYRKIGIPKGKIFIINPKGEVAISHRIDVKSYTSLHTLVNEIFPPTSLVEQEDYNSWNFWRMPLPDVDI